MGSTIYPGMMVTAAWLFRTFEFFDLGISLNDVCVFIPAGFGVTATLFTWAWPTRRRALSTLR